MTTIRYTDSGHQLDDATTLRNTVYFTTAQRVFATELLLRQPLDVMTPDGLAFAVIQAFQEFILATEDVLGWYFALRDWEPGNPKKALFYLLHTIDVAARGRYSERSAHEALSALSVDEFRKLIHLPTEQEMSTAGLDPELVARIMSSLSAKLDGFRKTAELRLQQDRGLVRTSNKLKHMFRAYPVMEDGAPKILIPYELRFVEPGTGTEADPEGLHIRTSTITVSAREVTFRASQAASSQLALHDTLAVILQVRYGHEYRVPEWARRALDRYFP